MKFIKLTNYNNNHVDYESDFNNTTYITVNPKKIINIEETYKFNPKSGFNTNEHCKTVITTTNGSREVSETAEEIVNLCNEDINLKNLKITNSMRQKINALEDEIKDLEEEKIEINKRFAKHILDHGDLERHPEESLAALEIFNNKLFKGLPNENPLQIAVKFADDYLLRHSYGISGLGSPYLRLEPKDVKENESRISILDPNIINKLNKED
jgi:hypothetical protein